MKKLLPFCFLFMIISTKLSAQHYQLKYVPNPNSLKHEWLQNFINNNKEGIKVLPNCDVGVKNKNDWEAGDYSFVLFYKGNKAMGLYNLGGKSYVLPVHDLPKANYNSYYTNLFDSIAHDSHVLIELNNIRFFLERKKLLN